MDSVLIFSCYFPKYDSDSYNPVPGVMTGVPSSRNYDGGFSSKLMVRVDIYCHFLNTVQSSETRIKVSI